EGGGALLLLRLGDCVGDFEKAVRAQRDRAVFGAAQHRRPGGRILGVGVAGDEDACREGGARLHELAAGWFHGRTSTTFPCSNVNVVVASKMPVRGSMAIRS